MFIVPRVVGLATLLVLQPAQTLNVWCIYLHLPPKVSTVNVGTLPETNSSHLKMDGWNTGFLLGRPIFRGELLVLGSVSRSAPLSGWDWER